MNTVAASLNRHAPIAQTPEQALGLLDPPGGLDALLLVAEDGSAFLAWSARPVVCVASVVRGAYRAQSGGASERGRPGMAFRRSRIEGSK